MGETILLYPEARLQGTGSDPVPATLYSSPLCLAGGKDKLLQLNAEGRHLWDNLVPYMALVSQACSHILLEIVCVFKEKVQKIRCQDFYYYDRNLYSSFL